MSRLKKKQTWIRKTLDRVDVLIVLSHSWKKWFVEIGVSEDKIVVLHNITSYPKIDPSAKVEDNKIHFLFLGEIGDRKGVFDILKTIATHRDEFLGKIELRIGGNRNEDLLQKTITDSKLEDIVKFEGWVSGDKKIKLLNWANVFMLPSYNEGLPISILEAMSYRMPIVTTPVGGIPEVVESKVNGTLVTPGDVEELYHAMKKYLDTPDVVKKEGEESYKKVETYLPDYVMQSLNKLYVDLLNE